MLSSARRSNFLSSTMHKAVNENPRGYGEALHTGRIFQLTRNEKGWELATRPPGTRLLILRQGETMPEMLITKEFRQSFNDYDYRLPGGKVVDTLDEYLALDSDEAIYAKIEEAVHRESLEEAGIKPHSMTLYQSTRQDATVQWNLYFMLIEDFEEVGQQANDYEEEEIHPHWMPLDEVFRLCMEGHVQENRSRAVLYDYILNEHPQIAIRCLNK